MMSPRNLPSVLILAVVVAASTGAAVTAGSAVADTTPATTPTPTPTPAPANPTPPSVATTGVSALSKTTATVTGAVTPGSADTTYRFQYGTSSSYGLSTSEASVPAGTTPVNVSRDLSGLTVGTTYHYRLVATNAAGTTNGSDKTFSTQSNPKSPTVSTLSATAVAATTAQLNAHVNPNGQPTNVSFQWGTSTKYGATTPVVSAGTGTSTLTSSIPIGGLAGNTKYHYRAVAQNATGTVRGSDHTFTTPRDLTGVGLTITPTTAVWGTTAVVSGTVGGAGVGGVGVKLLQQDYPFTGTFRQIATQTASSAGAYSFSVPNVTSAIKLQVVTNTAVPVTSPVATLRVSLFTALKVSKKTSKTYTLSGTIYPQVPKATVSVQRRTPKGRWITTKHAHLTKIGTTGSAFKTNVSRISRTTKYRVHVSPKDNSAHVITDSSTVSVAKRKK
ncbi:MAG: hypothetical protein AAGC46_11155 [Solirubrobacteraceae bacterium]|nr:hypothetical protein [Patulibacter sp.]